MTPSIGKAEARDISFDDLPLDEYGPQGNAWGRFGKNDQLGTLNLLTPTTTLAAAKEIQLGIRIPLDLPLNKFTHPWNKRVPFHQQILTKTPRASNDDLLTFNTQGSTQWDGFRHYGYQDRKLYYNGHQQAHITETMSIGIDAWSKNGGITGRGVLLDYHSWAEAQNISHPGLSSTSVSLADLIAVAEHQKIQFQAGDILFVRYGFLQAYFALSLEEQEAVSKVPSAPCIGVLQSEELMRWLWNNRFAAVAGDAPSFEVWPCRDKKFWLHEWALAGWGLPIGELFDLDQLAVECEKIGRWTFFFSSMPLNVM